jgi:hypothetical protein
MLSESDEADVNRCNRLKRLVAVLLRRKVPKDLSRLRYIQEVDDERDELEREDFPRPPWLALPPLEAIFRCVSLSIAAKPRLLVPRAIGLSRVCFRNLDLSALLLKRGEINVKRLYCGQTLPSFNG